MNDVLIQELLELQSQFDDHNEEGDSEWVRDFGYAKQVSLLFEMRDHKYQLCVFSCAHSCRAFLLFNMFPSRFWLANHRPDSCPMSKLRFETELEICIFSLQLSNPMLIQLSLFQISNFLV